METEIAVQTAVITVPDEIVGIKKTWLATKHQELEAADKAIQSLEKSGATPRKVQRVKERRALLRKTIAALDAGFLPIPRFSSQKLTLDQEELPLKAVLAIENAVAQKLFDEFRFVTGQQGNSRRGRYARQAQRDPIVVGVVRTLEHGHRGPYEWIIDVPSMEEHFLVAWWRPEDQHPTDWY